MRLIEMPGAVRGRAIAWPLRIWVSVRNMFTSYGSEHRRFRSLVSSAFTVRRAEALRPRIEATATELLDRIEKRRNRSTCGRITPIGSRSR